MLARLVETVKKVSILLPYYNRKKLLLNTLRSYEYFYADKSLEICIVDDGSAEDQRIDDVSKLYPTLDIKLYRVKVKNGINPCVPYNIAARISTGDVLVLTSPETFHTADMYELSSNFSEVENGKYLCFSVFCLTDQDIYKKIFSDKSFESSINIFNEEFRALLFDDLGEEGRAGFSNRFGSWYLHSQYRPSSLNFFTALKRELYFGLSGFDESYRNGTGYDDNEFLDRLRDRVDDIVYIDDACAIHVDHPPVYGKGSPISNQAIYLSRRKYLKNDDWGKLV